MPIRRRAAAYYDALLATIGAKRLWEFGRGIVWGVAQNKPSLAIMKRYDGNAASVGNGVMVALMADSRESVDRLHKKALDLGSRDEGPVGPRIVALDLLSVGNAPSPGDDHAIVGDDRSHPPGPADPASCPIAWGRP